MIQILLFILTLVFDKGFIEAEKRNVVVDLYPCPNCEEWCANKKYEFTCEYTCNYKAKPGVNENDLHYLYEKYGTFRPNPKQVEECTNEKNINCILHNDWYPICNANFEPYDDGMDKCCKVLQNCDEKSVSIYIEKKCAPEYPLLKDEEIFSAASKFEFSNYKFWAFQTDKNQSKLTPFFEWCGMKCNNSRLISLNPTRPKTTTTLATTTPLPTTTKIITKKPIQKITIINGVNSIGINVSCTIMAFFISMLSYKLFGTF